MSKQKHIFLSACLTLSADAKGKPDQFTGVAYTGGFVSDYGLVIDLASARYKTPMHLLHNHRPAEVIGVVDAVDGGTELSVSGTFFTKIDEEADRIVAKARAGAPYELSVGVYDYTVEFIGQGKTVEVNGQTFTGPVEVLRNSSIRETSIVALGADPDTSVKMLSKLRHTQTERDTVTPEEIEALKQESVELKAQVDGLKTQLSASATAAREEEVKALFSATGREYCEASAKPWIEMSADVFRAASAQMMELGAAKPDDLQGYTPSQRGADSLLLTAAKARYNLT